MPTFGVDLGTTTLSTAVVGGDSRSRQPPATDSRPHGARLPASQIGEQVQDADLLCQMAIAAVDDLQSRFGVPDAIGITGQMHGILYLDRRGRAVSPLYTWLDGRGASWIGEIERIGGWRLSAGFGLATHYANVMAGSVPSSACSVGTIMDYVVMRLCDLNAPVSDPSCAASIGCYRHAEGNFDWAALRALGIDGLLLPRIVPAASLIGRRADGTPVAAPLGDNQASVLGVVGDMDDALLVNIGTGAQVSQIIPAGGGPGAAGGSLRDGGLERRPFVGDRDLAVGAALAGGRAIEMLADLFAEIATLSTGSPATGSSSADGYSILERLSDRVGRAPGDPLRVDTRFAGSRGAPDVTGSIANITVANFGAAELLYGVLRGLADELYGLWRGMQLPAPARLFGSGGALRRYSLLRRLIAEVWGMPLQVCAYDEAAAVGAARSAMRAVGLE